MGTSSPGPVRRDGGSPEDVARVLDLMERSRLVPSEIMRSMISAAMRQEADRRLDRTVRDADGPTVDHTD